ncbi:MAG: efflux RND transporter periplasmic adaptor subunit [Myxococcales bacterium]|nr:MAG: efflux RND transporter periplasmic adaptor subunit [Myxococcales bacterium]
MRRGDNRRWLGGLAACLMLVLFSGCGKASSAAPETDLEAKVQAATAVSAVTLQTEPYTLKISTTGTALPARESYLACEVPGIIAEILVKEGDRVKKGQALLRFNREGYRLSVEQAEAGVAASKAQADQMKIEYERALKLRESDATARASLERVKAQYDAAVAGLQAAEVGVKKARKAVADSELRAPYNGTIVMILHEIGEYAPSMPPTMLMKIVDTSSLDVQVFLPEDQAANLAVGAPAEIEMESVGAKMEGKVSFVSNRVEMGAQSVETRIHLDNPEGRIKGGAFARVTLTARTYEEAILAPVRAVRRDEQGRPYVFLAVEGKAKRTSISLGGSEQARILILDGLKAGDALITTGLDDLMDGDAVAVEARDR